MVWRYYPAVHTLRLLLCPTLAVFALACETKEDVPDEGAQDDTTTTQTETETETETGDAATETGGTGDDSADCDLWEGDATYPGDCACASEGEECVQGCFDPDGVITCAQICADLGEVCVENGCDGGTYTGGPGACPAPSEYGQAVANPCDAPVPELGELGDSPNLAECCCTRS